MLFGLEYLHAQGVLHRDIKGANILTTKTGVAKVADFGVAVHLSALPYRLLLETSRPAQSIADISAAGARGVIRVWRSRGSRCRVALLDGSRDHRDVRATIGRV